MKSLNKMLLIMFLFYSIPRIAYGDDAQINELRSRIEYLQKQVETMNQTLIQMMAILDSSSSVSRSQQSVSPNKLKWEDKQNWRKLRSGMSKGEVTGLLGEPDIIDKFSSFEVWQYGDPERASAHFSSDERIRSWSEPR
jgi:hypothetical protein